MCDDKGRVKWLLLRGPGNNGKILDKSKFLLSKVLVIVDGNVTVNLCKMDAIDNSHKCVSVHQNPPHTNASKYIRAHLPVRDIMGNCGHRDNAAGEKFPGAGQRQFRETFPFSVMLHPVNGGMPVVRLTML